MPSIQRTCKLHVLVQTRRSAIWAKHSYLIPFLRGWSEFLFFGPVLALRGSQCGLEIARNPSGIWTSRSFQVGLATIRSWWGCCAAERERERERETGHTNIMYNTCRYAYRLTMTLITFLFAPLANTKIRPTTSPRKPSATERLLQRRVYE